MNNIIEKLRNSKSILLQTEANDWAKWSKLNHTKEDLETMLQFNLVELSYANSNGVVQQVVCTSNAAFIKIFSLSKKKDKQKYVNLKSNGIHTKDKTSILTWNLVDNKYNTIYLNNWYVVNFISIVPENVLVLDEIVHSLLKI